MSFTVDGGVAGLLGPNGAGKTTLLETICTLLTPAAGRLEVLGRSVSRRQEVRAIRRRVGFLPQEFGYIPGFTAQDFVEYAAWSKGLAMSRTKPAAKAALAAVGLADSTSKRMRTLSGGMRRRVGIAAAIVHEPELLVLDEATVGLDPHQRVEFRHLIRRLAQDRTVLLSSHLMEDVAATCDTVLILTDGRVAFQGTTAQLAAQAGVDTLGDTVLERGYGAVVAQDGRQAPDRGVT